MTFEHERVERHRRYPDSDQRMRRSDDPGAPHRRARPRIAIAIGLVVLLGFVAILLTDDGDGGAEPFAAAVVG